ncbi:hypothetical protein JQ596_31420 [Bradyrhizobium manausense]|uniref:hypothetical protein n=1 Tax=Bradyrhizobium TaxID=374 RepID=UPI001BA598B8|nr:MULTISPECIES: hypothetical protein [Bradyrhizobium]MBR0830047.1 hypothetical protein [Bradyrhizobium manausense]UVO30975.1 hypothetical protein KUF59_10180 [Bradyrhizobium arachidis]
MNKALITAIAMLAFAPVSAVAQERAGDAALGAVSGAIVLGPVGAVAGAFVGYAAGPSIARSWGLRGSRSATQRQRPRGEASRAANAAAPSRTREAMNANGQARPAATPPVQAETPAAPPAPQPSSAPPVQSFD